MKFTFVQPASFVSDWRRLGLTDADLQALEAEIMDRPSVGAVLRGAGGLRKMRFAPRSQHVGKSGATRVCYVVFERAARCYLLIIFPKNEQSNLSAADKARWRSWIAAKHKELNDEDSKGATRHSGRR